MSKASKQPPDDMRPEYDFASMKGGIRGKYYAAYRAGTNLALIEPDLSAAFPTDADVNRALRAVVEMASVIPRRRTITRKSPGQRPN